MVKKTNQPKLIGVFVIGAIVLVIAGILAFGGSRCFSPKIKFIAFFPSASLSGLAASSSSSCRALLLTWFRRSQPRASQMDLAQTATVSR
jgi:hypothetical protein